MDVNKKIEELKIVPDRSSGSVYPGHSGKLSGYAGRGGNCDIDRAGEESHGSGGQISGNRRI